MAQKPDGKAVRTERVTFTKPAAERIAKVVRTVEQGDRGGAALTFGAAPPAVDSRTFRMATFTGAWAIDVPRSVKFYNQTSTPNTVTVNNILFPLPELSNNTNTPTVCAIAKDRNQWYLLQVVHAQQDMLSGVSLQPSSLQFTRRSEVSISATAATTGIALSSCESKASSQQLSTFLG